MTGLHGRSQELLGHYIPILFVIQTMEESFSLLPSNFAVLTIEVKICAYYMQSFFNFMMKMKKEKESRIGGA